MSSAMIIKQQIEKTVSGHYSDWKIGITHDPTGRKAQLGNPLSWLQWKADTEREAWDVAQEFLEKGMKSAGGTTPKAAEYVYIFTE